MQFYFTDAVPPGAILHRSLQDGGVAPPGTILNTGWVANAKGIGQSCLMVGGTKVARIDVGWSSTLQPAGPPSPSFGDCWRSERAYKGTFDAGDWNFVFGIRSATAAYTGRLKLAVRIWRSADPTGANATELTTGRVVSVATTAALSTTANAQVNIDWLSAPSKTLVNEYLFVNTGIQITSPGGNTSQDVVFFIGMGTGLVTPDFIAPSRTFAAVTG